MKSTFASQTFATIQAHSGTTKAVAGSSIALAIEDALPWLSAVVFLLTAANLIMEIRKKLKKGK